MTSQPPSPGPAPAAAPPPPSARWWRRVLGAGARSWRSGLAYHRDFRQLWVGDTISQLGTQLSLLALPILAVTTLHASPAQMGVLEAAGMAAFLIIGLPAGALVDRWDRRRVLISNDLLRVAAFGSIPVAWAAGWLTLPQLYVVALITGIGTVFFDVAYQSYLPSLVAPDQIVEGNSKLQASQSVAQVAGPAIAGGLLHILAAPAVIAVDAVSYLLSAFYVGRIRHRDAAVPKHERRRLRSEIAEGLSFVVRHPLLVRITACTSLFNLFGGIANALLILFLVRRLHLDAGTIGLVFSAGSVGGLLGAVTASPFARWVGEGRAIPVSALISFPFAALTPLAVVLPVVPTLIVGVFGMFWGIVVYNVTQVSFRQRLCPPRLLGRMNASIRFLVWGVQPIGALIGGWLGTRFGLLPGIWVSVAGQGIAALPVLVSPLIRMRDLPRHLDETREAG